jgi:hypothetical protein
MDGLHYHAHWMNEGGLVRTSTEFKAPNQVAAEQEARRIMGQHNWCASVRLEEWTYDLRGASWTVKR